LILFNLINYIQMKNLTILLIFLPFICISQPEFSFDLYFEDALGNRDTVTIGYDPQATDGIDAQFGEENIISQPWDSILDVRIALGHFPPYGGSIPVFFPSKQTKKQISIPYCESNYYNAYKFVIQLKNAVFPVKLNWYTERLNSLCTASNFVTDWFPGCWFDCQIIGNEQEPWFFLNSDSLILEHTSLVNSYDNDTTNLLFVSMSNGNEEIGSHLELINNQGMKVVPNPFDNSIFINSQENIQKIEILSLTGNLIKRLLNVGNSQMEIDTEFLSSGSYILSVQSEFSTINRIILKK
jgi:hypothetical protein